MQDDERGGRHSKRRLWRRLLLLQFCLFVCLFVCFRLAGAAMLLPITRALQRIWHHARAPNPHNPSDPDDDCEQEARSTRNFKTCVASSWYRLRSASESTCLIRASLVFSAQTSPSVMSSASAPLPHLPAEQQPSSRRRQGVELTWNQQRRQVKCLLRGRCFMVYQLLLDVDSNSFQYDHNFICCLLVPFWPHRFEF